MIPEPSSGATSGPPAVVQRNQRYTYLVARLRNRQMTMEEATELFGLMDGMLRASEAARVALSRAVPSVPPAAPSLVAPRREGPPPAPGGGDDFLLLGILAMGAGAGLLAAMTRRIQEPAPPSSSASAARPGSGSTSR